MKTTRIMKNFVCKYLWLFAYLQTFLTTLSLTKQKTANKHKPNDSLTNLVEKNKMGIVQNITKNNTKISDKHEQCSFYIQHFFCCCYYFVAVHFFGLM